MDKTLKQIRMFQEDGDGVAKLAMGSSGCGPANAISLGLLKHDNSSPLPLQCPILSAVAGACSANHYRNRRCNGVGWRSVHGGTLQTEEAEEKACASCKVWTDGAAIK